MDIQKPLFWQQGLFLQPQHFQQNDLYVHSLLNPLHKFIQPHFWGVASLDISPAALGNQTIDITKGEFVFSDNTHVVYPGNAMLAARSFESTWQEKDKPLKVYLGLRKWDESGENVTVLSDAEMISDASTRYVTTADSEELVDMHHTGPAGQVRKMKFLLKIFWDTEKDKIGDYLLIPLAVLEKDGEEIRLAGRYVPPAMNIKSVSGLFNTVKEIRDLVASRARQLEEYKSQKGVHTAEFGARDMVFLLALRSLNRYVPLLFHFTEALYIHPWTVYGMLRQLVGELSSFSDSINVMGTLPNGETLMGEYDHSDLGTLFLSSLALITGLLDEITAGPEYILKLLFDGTYFAVDLPGIKFEGKNRFYLVVETDTDPKTVIDALQGIAKLGTRETLPLLLARALPGVGLEHLPVPPQELPRRVQSVYFQIDHHSDQWKQVESGKNIALYWDSAPEDIKVELMIVGGQ